MQEIRAESLDWNSTRYEYTRGVKYSKRWIYLKTMVDLHICDANKLEKLFHLMRTQMLPYLNYADIVHTKYWNQNLVYLRSLCPSKNVSFLFALNTYFNISRNIKFCTHLSIAFLPTSSLFSILWISPIFFSVRLA